MNCPRLPRFLSGAAGNDVGRGRLTGTTHPQGAPHGVERQEKHLMELNGKRIAILATHGFEQSELEGPRERLKKAGATVEIVSLASGEIRGWDKKDWGRPVKIDKTLDRASSADYDAVVLPGGQINPDLLRVEPKALKFIKEIFDAGKIVAAVCHAPWLL